MPRHVIDSTWDDVRSGVATAVSGGSIWKGTGAGWVELAPILRSPDGTAWKIAVADDGTVSAAKEVPAEGDTWDTAGSIAMSQFSRGWVGLTIGASVDPGFTEPAVWVRLYGYSIPTGASVTVDTNGSDFDTILRIYTCPTMDAPTSAADLTLVAENDDGPLGMTSEITFVQNPSLFYWAAIVGYDGESGFAVLNVTFS